jgi:FkbM family methyltransferase
MPEAKELLRRALFRANLEVRRRHRVPFGVSWTDDVGHYLQGRPVRVAFDIGAHRGQTARKLLRAFPGVQVHSFEPLPENFAVLQETTAGIAVRNVNAAVSDRSGTVTIARARSSDRASVYGSGERVELPAVTVDDYVREQGVDRVDVLKIDTEGHEEAILRGSLAQLESGRTEFVFCECEFSARSTETHGDFHAIHALLEPLGYRVVSFYTGAVDKLGWIWGDVLFRRAPGADERLWATSPHPPRRTLGVL